MLKITYDLLINENLYVDDDREEFNRFVEKCANNAQLTPDEKRDLIKLLVENVIDNGVSALRVCAKRTP